MSKAVAGEENVYFEMESKPGVEARIYEDLVGESELHLEKSAAEQDRQTSTGPIHSCSTSDSVIIQRLLCVIVALVAVSFLTAAATLVLALKMMMLPNTSSSQSADCAVVQGMRKKIQDLTERLESMQSELNTRNPTSTPVHMNGLKDVWMVINSTAEKTSNLTSEEQTLKKGQYLERVLNATQKEVKISYQRWKDLWFAGQNLTLEKELLRVWMTLNGTKIQLEEKLMMVKKNYTTQEMKVQGLTERLNSTVRELKTLKSNVDDMAKNPTKVQADELRKLWMVINSTAGKASELSSKLSNISNSKMAGPIGPPGFNGSQGPAGPAGRNGSMGPPGPKGSGNFSACKYKLVTEQKTPGATTTTASFREPNGKRVLGVSCSTNYAAEYNLLSTVHNSVRLYSCTCKGTSSWFKPSGDPSNCYIHYWECPLTT